MGKTLKKKILKIHHAIKDIKQRAQKIKQPFLELTEPRYLLNLQYSNIKTDTDE